jgi:rhodanese-related sulfurtransferase
MRKKEERRKKQESARLGVAAVALVVLMSGAVVITQSMRAVPRVTIDELKTLIAERSVVVLDVRTADEFSQGRIPGAININYTEIFKEAGRFAGEKRTIVAYCACANEMTAARAAVDLAQKGVPGAKALKGGWNEWLERREAVEK